MYFTEVLAYIESYKRLNKLLQDESLEPLLSWGFRMGLSGTLPIAWGLHTGHITDGIWITLTAEAVSWVELKGSFAWRLRALVAGSLLAIFAGALGSVTGGSLLLGCLCMLVVGFLATLLKNLGDRASGLAICFYLLFIVCNAFPVTTTAELPHRMMLISIGAMWPVLVGLIASALMPAQEPFRRHVAIIWRSIADLAEAVSQSDNRAGYTSKLANVYEKERQVRATINNSFEFYAQTANQANTKDNRTYQLIQMRKLAGLVAVNVIAMGDEMEHISVHKLDKALRVKADSLFRALKEASDRMSVFVITMNPEEKLLTQAQVNRLRNLIALIREYPMPPDVRQSMAIARILQLTERTIRLLDNAILRVDQMGDDKPVFRSYSLIKTGFLFKPQFLLRNIRTLFNINTLTFKYAMRSAVAATVALFVYKWFEIDHGFWMPFSVMIIIQPYFGATFKKAIDRITGTVLGVLAGSFLLYLPQGLYLQEIILFFTFILMVYYAKKQYAVSAFFITLNLVLLFNIESSYSNELMGARVVATIGGALLAVSAGWLLLPTWDKKLLPAFLSKAVAANYEYFVKTFYAPEEHANWTRYKRLAESGNSNVYDSFNRYMQEPGREKSDAWYALITCTVRITRSLNNIHMEQAEKRIADTAEVSKEQQQKVTECLQLFDAVLVHMDRLKPGSLKKLKRMEPAATTLVLNTAQSFSLEKMILELKAMLVDLDKSVDV